MADAAASVALGELFHLGPWLPHGWLSDVVRHVPPSALRTLEIAARRLGKFSGTAAVSAPASPSSLAADAGAAESVTPLHSAWASGPPILRDLLRSLATAARLDAERKGSDDSEAEEGRPAQPPRGAQAAVAACPLLRRGVELESARWLSLLALEFCCACAPSGARAAWAWPLRDALVSNAGADLADALAYAGTIEGARCMNAEAVRSSRSSSSASGAHWQRALPSSRRGCSPTSSTGFCMCTGDVAAARARGVASLLGASRGRLLAVAQWLLLTRLLPELRQLAPAAAMSLPALPLPPLVPPVAAPQTRASKRSRCRGCGGGGVAPATDTAPYILADIYPRLASGVSVSQRQTLEAFNAAAAAAAAAGSATTLSL